MKDWMITFVLVFLAYQVGYRNGWKTYESTVIKALNRIAHKLGKPIDDSFGSNSNEN